MKSKNLLTMAKENCYFRLKWTSFWSKFDKLMYVFILFTFIYANFSLPNSYILDIFM